jgi:hypothetical protein
VFPTVFVSQTPPAHDKCVVGLAAKSTSSDGRYLVGVAWFRWACDYFPLFGTLSVSRSVQANTVANTVAGCRC